MHSKKSHVANLFNQRNKDVLEDQKDYKNIHKINYILIYNPKIFKKDSEIQNNSITDEDEYNKRIAEIKKLISLVHAKYKISLIEGNYEPEKFLEMAKGLEKEPERGKRCYKCYEMRLEETARIAEELGFDNFCTTLTLSPHKNANWINEIGEKLNNKYKANYLYSDFKKKEGYKRSIVLSKEYGLYRQDYCGCIFSKK